MKKIFILNLIFIFISFSSYSQDFKKITISINETNLKNALIILEKKTELSFYFKDSWVDNEKTISKTYINATIESILSDLLQDYSINYFIKNNKVFLTKNSAIYDSLPNGFFKNNETPTYNNKDVLFKNQYNNTITIGKQNEKIKKSEYKVSGKAINPNTGNPIQNLVILVKDKNRKTNTDKNGDFTLTIPAGFNTIETKLLGYQNTIKDVIVYGDGKLDLLIEEDVEKLDEILIETNKKENIKKAVVGITKIDVKGIKNIPVVLGERDILKIATTLPGIKTPGEGAAGFNVRGGRSDQNLILLDDAVIYNPSHFLGFFTAINPFATGSVDIYKASIPVNFGGRLSSVFDIKTKKPNYEKFSGEGSIGPVTGSINLQTPIIKDKSSLTTAFRATYSDWILKSLKEETLKNSQASFYDALIKYDHKINDNNKVQATGYYSNDKFSITSDSIFKYNNSLLSLKWNHSFNKKHKSELIFANSNYSYDIDYDSEINKDLNFNFNFIINETQLKLNMKYLHSKKHKFNYGVSSKLYTIDPGILKSLGNDSKIKNKTIDKEKGLESAIYVSDMFEINKKLLLNAGLRFSAFNALGARTQNIYEEGVPKNSSTIKNVLTFDNNENIKTYSGLEPRVSLRYSLSSNMSLKASFNSTLQYIHLLSNNTTSSPTDTWKLSDLNTKPQRANQYALGLYKNLNNNDVEISVEVYYKKMKDILNYKIGAELILNESIEQELLQGTGKAYGVEFLLKKSVGKFNGWLAYTYSKSLLKLNSNSQQEEVNSGGYFPTNADKPHDLSLVTNYKLTKRYSFSANFIYQTGRPITYPVGKYNFAGSEQVLYSDRNKFRIPDYYRLDLGINIEGNHKIKKLAHSFWNISVYNVLGRNNPYSIYFVNNEGVVKAYKTSIFSIPIPTITYNFKF